VRSTSIWPLLRGVILFGVTVVVCQNDVLVVVTAHIVALVSGVGIVAASMRSGLFSTWAAASAA
jgi:hypothetical protein